MITVEMIDMLHDCEAKLRWIEEACSAFCEPGDTIDFLREEADRLYGKFRREADTLGK